MKILISPAKKMRTDTDTLSPQALPAFLPETERLLSALRSLSRQELKQLWRCSDAITDLNVERLARMELGKGQMCIRDSLYTGILIIRKLELPWIRKRSNGVFRIPSPAWIPTGCTFPSF